MSSKVNHTINESADILTAMAAINAGGCYMCVVLDDDGRLLGALSDGDIRRAILRGITPDQPVASIINRHPFVVRDDEPLDNIRTLLRDKSFMAVPVVDTEGRLVRIATIHEVVTTEAAAAVIMAGGEGRRLLPFTENTPKPMMMVGDKPLIEHAVNRLAKSGIQKVHVAVNYLADKIRSHLGDGSDLGTDISYLEERSKLGTAGALSLLKDVPSGPLLVMNGDILTGIDFSRMLAFHGQEQCGITIGVVEYHIQIPYGVINIEEGRVIGLIEKPEQRMPISAGIYVIEPRILRLIPPGQFYNMTDLIADALQVNEKVSPFLIHEEWLDIGTPKDLERAQSLAMDIL